MRTAFIVLRSPQEARPAHAIKRFSSREDASVILFEDGVYQAVLQKNGDELAGAAEEIFVCDEDLEARGFAQSDLAVGKAVGYDAIVDCIMERTERTITV